MGRSCKKAYIKRCIMVLLICLFPSSLYASGRYLVYRVRRGDSLYSVARKYHSSLKRIAIVNGLHPPYIIYKGQHLKIPLSYGAYRLYRVRRGDTLNRIAKRYRIRWRTLARMNKLKSPYTIYRGQYIKIPLRVRKRVAYRTRLPKRSTHSIPRTFTPPVIKAEKITKGMNMGMNYTLSKGEEVLPSSPGRVVYSSLDMRGLGSVLILEHPGGYETVYAGKGIYWLVGEGEDVKRGDVLGEAVDDTVLHFEIRKKGRPLPVRKLVRERRGK